MPAYTSREVLVLFGSLTTCDPGDIKSTIKELKENQIRVSIIGLAAEVRICRQIAKETGGEYSVLLDDHHLKELILNLVQPPLAGGWKLVSFLYQRFCFTQDFISKVRWSLHSSKWVFLEKI